MTIKNVPIKYTSRDFDTIKAALVEHARRYYEDTYRDFSDVGFGSLMLDTVAYIGDILSFYLDYQANESFMVTANEYGNVVKMAKQLGFKFKTRTSSHGILTLFVVVPANSTGLGPDIRYAPIVKKGSIFSSNFGISFMLNSDVSFANSNNQVVVARVDSSTGFPTHYAIRAHGTIISGQLYSQVEPVGNFRKFLRIQLDRNDAAEIVSVFDSEGHEYFEVDNLSQNIIYRPLANVNFRNDNVASILKPYVAARRFIVERDGTNIFLRFGHGSETLLSDETIVDPSAVVLEVHGKNYIPNSYIDPNKLNNNDKFGIAPSNTYLNIIYRVNTNIVVNARANSINKVISPIVIFVNENSLELPTRNSVINSLEITNEDPIIGSATTPSIEEFRQSALDFFASQDRAVTVRDYISTIYSMSPQFGSIKRAKIMQDHDSFKRNLNLYLISENADGTLVQTNEIIKKNLKSWLIQKKMINDTIDIFDAKIVNFGIVFEAIANPENDKELTLAKAVVTLENEFANKMDIGEPLYITKIYSILNDLKEIADVTSVRIISKIGANYSSSGFNIQESISADGRFVKVPDNVIMELKFPRVDIRGTIK